VGEIAADAFLTFIPPKPAKAQSLDVQFLLLEIVKRHSFSIREFWEMPLFLVLELLGMLASPKKQAMSRKTLIDNEKRMNRRNNGN